jgi:RNA ligase (TIGR02306 family)
MERKLATVRRIKEILPIEGADRIELAVVDGWKVVVAKDVQHKVGDLVIYCEIDSFLPIREEFEFLRKSSYKKMGDQEGFRLRTAKMKGQISQGLILPISVLNPPDTNIYVQPFEGLDVTEMLDIVKYEPPIPANLAGKVKGLFPSFLIKTDEERVQNIAVEYSALCFQSKHQFYVTEKLDGSSATFYINNGEFGVCSRNLELLETENNSFWKVARELKLEENLRALEKNICLQGELIGESIQGNPYGIKGQTVRFFSVYQIDSRTRLGIKDLEDICFMIGLQTVPILESNFLLPNTIEEMLQYAEGKSALNPKTEREGVVVRSLDGTISFKAISNKFLLKNEQ